MAGAVQGNARVRAPVASRYVPEHEMLEQKRKAKKVEEQSSQVPSGSLKNGTAGSADYFHLGAFVNHPCQLYTFC